MARYIIERTFPDGLRIPMTETGRKAVNTVIDNNTGEAVTWVHSYVNEDRTKTFCVYDGPSPEAIRRVAERNGLPVDAISEVRVLDPYFYTAD
jgi:Nickel responsive protein SCO4226-like